MGEKRVIEQVASNEVHNDDWFLKDSPTQDTSKISATNLKAILGADGTLALEKIANAIAEEYDSTHTYYNTGLVFHEGVLYQCTASSVTGTWDSTKWNAVDIKDLLDNVSTNIGYLWNTISNTIADNYDTSSTYDTGDYVIYSLKLYRCKDDGVTGAWNSSKWEEVNIPEYIDYVLANAGIVKDVKVDGTSVVNEQGEAEIEIPVKDVQVKTDSTYDSVVDASGNAKIDLSSMTAYGEVPNLPQAIATFKDGASAPMKSLKVAIEPQQDLHGYDSPWVGGAGKNLIPLTVDNLKNINTDWSGDSTTKGGITFTILKDAVGNVTGIKANGTATQTAQLYLAKNFHIEGTTYTLSGFDSSVPQNNESYIRVYAPGNTLTINHDTSTNYKDLETLDNYTIWLSIASGTVVNNAIFYPQLEEGSTATSYAPYSNICPISGWTEAEVSVCGVNVWDEKWRIDQNQFKAQNLIPVMPNTTYYFKCPVDVASAFKYDKNKNALGILTIGKNTTFTTGADVYFIWFALTTDTYGTTYNHDISINYPSTDTEYHAYNGHTYTIDLDGTRYGGTLDVVSGVLTVDSVYYQFNSSKTYSITGSARLTNRWITSITNVDGVSDDIKSRSGVISSISPRDVEYTSITVSGFCKNLSSPYPIINLNDSDSGLTASSSATDIANAVNTFLHQHTPQIVYELATPITYQLSPTQVKSLLGQNNIWADTGDIDKAEYQRDATTIINELIARIEALEG